MMNINIAGLTPEEKSLIGILSPQEKKNALLKTALEKSSRILNKIQPPAAEAEKDAEE